MSLITLQITARCARCPHILLAAITLAALCAAQFAEAQSPQPSAPQANPPEAEKDRLVRRQAALAMLDLVLAGAKSLSLSQNRIAIASEAFPLLWNRNESQARALATEMAGDFAQAASRLQETPDPNSRPSLRQQWQVVLRTIAQSDAELALSFMNASRLSVQSGNPEQDEVEERRLRLELAAQQAAHDPRNALRAAEKDLQTPGDLPWELINLLAQVAAKDPEAGTQLLHDIVARVRSTDLSSPNGDFNFALNLLNSQASTSNNGTTPEDTLYTLADSIASTALNPQFPDPMLRTLQASLPAFERFAPSRRRRCARNSPNIFKRSLQNKKVGTNSATRRPAEIPIDFSPQSNSRPRTFVPTFPSKSRGSSPTMAICRALARSRRASPIPCSANRSCSKRCVNPHGTPVTREISRRPVNSHNKSPPRKIAPPCWRNSL